MDVATYMYEILAEAVKFIISTKLKVIAMIMVFLPVIEHFTLSTYV